MAMLEDIILSVNGTHQHDGFLAAWLPLIQCDAGKKPVYHLDSLGHAFP